MLGTTLHILQALLELAHDIFEEQTSLTSMVNKTMRRAINLFSCKQCTLLIIADPKHKSLTSEEVRIQLIISCKVMLYLLLKVRF